VYSYGVKKRAFFWAAFDFGETIFSLMVFTYAFPLFLDRIGGSHLHLTSGRAFSVLAFLILAPLWARHVDRLGGHAPRRHFLSAALLTGLFTALLGSEQLLLVVIAFGMAGFFYQVTLAFYNNLLPEAGEAQAGLASGLGVAFGYVGSAVALSLIRLFSPSYSVIFWGTALLFGLLGALAALTTPPRVRSVSPSLREVFRVVFWDRAFGVFLLLAFTLTEPAHTGILLLSLYFKRVFAMSDGQIALLLAGGALTAAVGALVWGWLAQRFSARWMFGWLFPLWAAGLLLAALTPRWGVFPLALLLGVLLAGIWVLLRLALLEDFGNRPLTLYFTYLALIERAASMVGPVLWSGMVRALHDTPFAFRMGTALLALFPLIGWAVYRKGNLFYPPKG